MEIENKFRGKRVDNGQWITGCLCESIHSGNYCIMPNPFFATRDFGEEDENEKTLTQDSMAIGGFFPVVLETIGRSVGFKNNSGIELFQGDIVKGNHKDNFVIVPMLGGLSLMNVNFLGKEGRDNNELVSHPTNEVQTAGWLKEREIVGNIYDK